MKILIVGIGSIAKKHIAAIRRCAPDAEIYALRSNASALPYEDVKNWYDWDTALSLRYDFIIISNPTANHRETIERLKTLETPLFIEKPLFDKLQGEELVHELVEKNIPTYIACNLRFLEVIKDLKQLVKGKRINEVNVYCGSFLPEWRPDTDYRKCYSANPEMGGGVHIDLIHEIDYIYWLFGSPVSVSKVSANKSSLEIRACDYANYLLEYDSFFVNITLNYYRRDSKRICEIVTSDDTYTANLLDSTIVNGKGEIIKEYTQRIIDTYNDQMCNFLAMLKTGEFNFNTIKDAYNVLKICLE